MTSCRLCESIVPLISIPDPHLMWQSGNLSFRFVCLEIQKLPSRDDVQKFKLLNFVFAAPFNKLRVL